MIKLQAPKGFIKILFLLFLVGTVFTSCVPTRKMIYFQKLSENDTLKDYYSYDRKYYRLQPNDIVSINVRTLDPKYDEIFNQEVSPSMGSLMVGGDYFYLYGYPLDDSGYVDLPIIGKLRLLGFTLEEAQKEVAAKVNNILISAFVTVRLGGLRYSILGEVSRPGKYTIMQNQVTLFDAIANAGDLTVVAKRDEVILIRQYPDGTKLHTLNLLDKNIIKSQYYWLQPNDIIYIKPLKVKSFGIGTSGFQTLTGVLTITTSLLLAISLLK